MQTGTSWEGIKWRARREDHVGPSKRLNVLVALLLLALCASVLAVVFVSTADARSCRAFAHTPRKIAAYRINGQADLGCTSPGETKTIYMDVYKHRNNWPDPRVCENQRASRAEDFGVGCSGPFRRGTGGLRLRGDYYTYAVGGGGRDYSPRKYLVPG